MKKYLLLTLLSFFSIKSYSQKWIYLGQNDIGDKTYIQNEKINSNDDYPKVWSKEYVSLFVTQKNGVKIPVKNAIVKSLYTYDCSEKRKKILAILVYNSKEKLITNNKYSTDDNDWNYAAPETTAEALLNYVCENF